MSYKVETSDELRKLIKDRDIIIDNKALNKVLSEVDTSNFVELYKVFRGREFNLPIGSWDVGKVESMGETFFESKYNHPLNEWDVSSVKWMKGTFAKSEYNHPLNEWDVSNVTSMINMFVGSKYNHPIGNWDISSVTDMRAMFLGAKNFKQDLESWGPKLHPDVKVLNMFEGSPLHGNEPSWYHERVALATERLVNRSKNKK